MSYAHAAGYHDTYGNDTHYQSGTRYQELGFTRLHGFIKSDAPKRIRTADTGGSREKQRVGQPVSLQKRGDNGVPQRIEK